MLLLKGKTDKQLVNINVKCCKWKPKCNKHNYYCNSIFKHKATKSFDKSFFTQVKETLNKNINKYKQIPNGKGGKKRG